MKTISRAGKTLAYAIYNKLQKQRNATDAYVNKTRSKNT